jgi:hypothetical protein
MEADHAPEEFARHLEEQRTRMREADALLYYAHSRTGLLARFLQRWRTASTRPAKLVAKCGDGGGGAGSD